MGQIITHRALWSDAGWFQAWPASREALRFLGNAPRLNKTAFPEMPKNMPPLALRAPSAFSRPRRCTRLSKLQRIVDCNCSRKRELKSSNRSIMRFTSKSPCL